MQLQEKYFKKAADICAMQEQSCFDIRKKLTNWGLPTDQQSIIIEKLEQENFIDERRYAGFYTKDKFNINGWGKIKIRYNLKSKQIPDDIIEDCLSALPDDKYTEKCKQLMKKKLNKIEGNSIFEKKNKLMRFVSSRGFETELIFTCIDEVLENE